MRIEANSKLVMIGDSITDCGRVKPVGEGRNDSLGAGYVSLVDSHLKVRYPEKRIRVVNMGLSGNTVRDLKARWQSDVYDLKPDWLSIMIGINDVWRQFDSPLQSEWGVPLAEYETTLSSLVEQSKARVKGLVLLTPYFIETNQYDEMRVRMDQYGKVVRELAKKNGTLFVDTQAAFDDVLKHMHPMTLAWDRVHPNQTGHMILAKAFLNAIGYQWE
jgi:lysophospholipase L1-like esterase